MKDNLQAGFQYYLQGFRLILKPGLRRYLILPLLINLLLMGLLFFSAVSYLEGIFNQWTASLAHWLAWLLGGLLWLLFSTSVWLLTSSVFVMLANLCAAPFYSQLSKKIIPMLRPSSPRLPAMTNTELILATSKRETLKILYAIPWLLASGLLFVIPLTLPLAPFIWALVNAWLLGLQYVDYAADNQAITLKAMRKILRRSPLTVLGFGFCVWISLLIPGANLLIPGAAVAGATAMWLALV